MTQKLLVGTDFSECCDRVLVYATKWFKVSTKFITGRKGQSLIRAKLFDSVASILVQISNHPVTVVP